MNCLFAYCTDRGTRRDCNQDSLLFRQMVCRGERAALAVLCDGMGGLQMGEEASASLVRAFAGWSEQELPALLPELSAGRTPEESWNRLLLEENERLGALGRSFGVQTGTTVTALLFCRGMYYAVHVGDCRAYEITRRIRPLTKDQTLAGREVEEGRLTRRKAAYDRRSHVLLQCVGASGGIRPAYTQGRIPKDAVYLLCCDGFWHTVREREMYRALQPHAVKEERLMEKRLRDMAVLGRKRGGQDDITALAVRPPGGYENA